MLWVFTNGEQRLRCCLEQDVIDHGFILIRDVADLFRHGEHDVKVLHGKQIGLPIF